MQPNIFDEKNKVQSNIMKFKKIGDRVQGTLIEKRTTRNILKGGADQLVYDLKTENGDIYTVFGKPGIDFQMKSIKIGQIIGMEYVKDVPPKTPGFNPTHIIQVYANPNLVDAEWLKAKEEEESAQKFAESEFNEPALPNFAEEVNTIAAGPNPLDKNAVIKSLAMTKIPGTTAENYMQNVVAATGLAYLPTNYDMIIAKLQ